MILKGHNIVYSILGGYTTTKTQVEMHHNKNWLEFHQKNKGLVTELVVECLLANWLSFVKYIDSESKNSDSERSQHCLQHTRRIYNHKNTSRDASQQELA